MYIFPLVSIEYDTFKNVSLDCVGDFHTSMYKGYFRALHLLRRYWERLNMVVQTGGTTDNPSAEREAYLRETHCLPTSSMWCWMWWSATGNPWWRNRRGGDSSNECGDTVYTAGSKIREWDDGRRRSEEGYQQLTVNGELFYAENGMVAFTDPGWIQLKFDMLTGLFEQVGIQTNFWKTVGMVCRPCQTSRVRTYESYT